MWAQSPDAEIPRQDELGIYEHLDTIIPGDIQFTNSDGRVLTLGQLIDKPTIISLVYYKCPGICPALMNGTSEAIKKTEMVLGTEYQVLTISFDETESPIYAARKKKHYASINKGQDVEHGWYFMTGDSVNIHRLLDVTGFRVKRQGANFIHAGALIVVSPKRKITRYLNGTYYNPFDVKMALIEAQKGQSSPTINKVLNYCFSYDPEGKKYVFNITKVAGSIILFFVALLLITMLIKEWKRKKLAKQANQ